MYFIILTIVVQSSPNQLHGATINFTFNNMLTLARCWLNNSFCHYCCFQVSLSSCLLYVCVSFGCTINVSICLSHYCRLTNQFDELNTQSTTGMSFCYIMSSCSCNERLFCFYSAVPFFLMNSSTLMEGSITSRICIESATVCDSNGNDSQRASSRFASGITVCR